MSILTTEACSAMSVPIVTEAPVTVSEAGICIDPSSEFVQSLASLISISASDEPSENVVTLTAPARGVKIIRVMMKNAVLILRFSIDIKSPTNCPRNNTPKISLV